MKLRSTPAALRGKDKVLFPAIWKLYQEEGVPASFHFRKGPTRCTIIVDYCHLHGKVADRLRHLYRAYLNWWLDKKTPERKRFPKGGMTITSFRDYIHITVLTEHAEWWVTLMDQAAAFMFDPHKHPDLAKEEAFALDLWYEKEKADYEMARELRYQEKLLKVLNRAKGKRVTAGDAAENRRRAEQRAREILLRRKVGSDVVRLEHDPVAHTGRLVVKNPDACDVIVARELFVNRDPEVCRIVIEMENAVGFPIIYQREGENWVSVKIVEPPMQSSQPMANFHNGKGKCMVKLYKSGDEMAVVTDATDERDFHDQFSETLARLVQSGRYDGDWEFQFRFWLEQYVEICCKLRGYKANVSEKRLLTAGAMAPNENMLIAQMDDRHMYAGPTLENGAQKVA